MPVLYILFQYIQELSIRLNKILSALITTTLPKLKYIFFFIIASRFLLFIMDYGHR